MIQIDNWYSDKDEILSQEKDRKCLKQKTIQNLQKMW